MYVSTLNLLSHSLLVRLHFFICVCICIFLVLWVFFAITDNTAVSIFVHKSLTTLLSMSLELTFKSEIIGPRSKNIFKTKYIDGWGCRPKRWQQGTSRSPSTATSTWGDPCSPAYCLFPYTEVSEAWISNINLRN